MLPKLTTRQKVEYIIKTLLVLSTIFLIMFTVCTVGTNLFVEMFSIILTAILFCITYISITEDYKNYVNSVVEYILFKLYNQNL
jgi:hypothetical protein